MAAPKNNSKHPVLTAVRNAAVWISYGALAGWQQWAGGAYSADLASQPDEAAHYVTGRMVYRYLKDGLPGPPLEFARDYYLHFPKVAFGIWPPGFHLTEAGWMLLFGASKVSVIAMMAALTATLMWMLYREARREFPESWAVAAGAFLGLIPMTQDCTSGIMPDSLVALTVFATAMLLRIHARNPRPRTAIACSLAAAVALTVKANSLALLLVVPMALTATLGWAWLKDRWLWFGAGLAAIIAGPWQALSMSLVEEREAPFQGFALAAQQFLHYLWNLITNAGFGVSALAAAGLLMWAWRTRRSPHGEDAAWRVYASLLAGYLMFHSVMPPPTRSRYMLALLPVVLLFAMRGARELARFTGGLRLSAGAAGTILCLLALIPSARSYYLAHKVDRGWAPIIAGIAADRTLDSGIVLVASDSVGEGAVVSEFAMLQGDRPRFVLRASKVVYSSSWKGDDLTLLEPDAVSLSTFLTDNGVDLAFVDLRPGALPASVSRQLRDSLAGWRTWHHDPAAGLAVYQSPKGGASQEAAILPVALSDRILGLRGLQ